MPETTEAPSVLSLIGNSLKGYVFAVQDFTLLALQSVRNLFSPPLYWADTLEQMDSVGVGSIFIVATAAVSIGGVLVLNTASQLQRFGMAALTGDGVSGRNASGMASELGSMVVTEQVDAMRALGTDPIRKLMTPRVVATVCMLPLLVALADFCGLGGGFIVAYFTLRLGAVQFWTRAIHALALADVTQGMVKPIVFGFIISTVGCYQGLRVKGGTAGVGRSTTTAVVISSITVLISDFFLSKLFLHTFE
jgi:phospholipid/cholesterol/gamma-HCH transport system permease protein